ncbi:uncharacterized protein LOC143481929 isoform X2 [Brachyhypopomus gauderio]|uniref:uncharacterized protein LOC143481929 isoform X2 n=1 Tax=Brachyhypopomus gauderio TaxID=698409 RepID=UPI0040427038
MGNTVSVRNETPYMWYYSSSSSGSFKPLCSRSHQEYGVQRAIHCYIYFRYWNHNWNTFTYEFNTHKGDPTFTLRESPDRAYIQLFCSTEGNVPNCPNYGKMEEDAQYFEQQRRQEEYRRQQEEERRRLERLERERMIQEEIDREWESSRNKLSQASERLHEKQSFKGHVQYQQQTQVLHQQIDDDAAAIERDEVSVIEDEFKRLLLKHQITEDKELETSTIANRIKTLHNEIMLKCCRENSLSVWSQFTFDQAVGYEDLSLTEKLIILEASLQLTLHSVIDTEKETDQDFGGGKQYDILFGLIEELYVTNPTLAECILLNILDSIPDLSQQSREILGQMLFNGIWIPIEIMLFIRKALVFNCNEIHSILYTAQTYQLSCLLTLSAFKDENPLMFLQQQAKNVKDKDADTILRELQEENCSLNTLVIMEDVLRYMESDLPKYQWVDLTKDQIEDDKRMIKSLDLANPDINILKQVLIDMSIAVQDSSTFTATDNQVIQGYFPRLTQLASLLLLLLSNKGCLLEIGTGEGKSCILAMFATIMAVRGVHVDIVTSSPVLARRDKEEWQKLFQMFGVTSSVIPPPHSGVCSSEEQDKLLKEAYRQQIVYGTVGYFAADTLKQEFEKRTTRGERKFEIVIVDEVDYMTLDNGVQVTFLSHEASGLRHLEQVIASIWAMISTCQPIEMLETGEIKWITRIQHFHKTVTSAVMRLETSEYFSVNEILLPGVDLGFYSQEDIEMLCRAETKTEEEKEVSDFQDSMSKAFAEVMKKIGISQQYDLLRIFEEVFENSVAFHCYSENNKKAKTFGPEKVQADLNIEMLLLEGGLACEIMAEKSLIEETVSTINSFIKYSDKVPSAPDFKESKMFIVIPFFLKNYIENQLPVLVENALKAVEMTLGREYMIDISPAAERGLANGPEKHEYNSIIPVDFRASGVLEKNKKWGNGLQQFLEMKHHLAVSSLSNVTNYMSNFHYFKRYINGTGIFGVSGTLGGDADKDFLARHYETKSYTIPAHRHKKVVELPSLQVKGDNNEWIQTICECSWKVADRGQVVLVICEDVKTANEVHRKMNGEGSCKADQITLYTISERHNIEKQKFCAGRIIIATNLGGRGTDIKVEESVNECGGLFVLLTHFPRNRRVEKQIFGRTARKGNPGMVQMILNQDHLAPAYQDQSVEIMRQLREEYEIKRIHDMESDELVEINLKEKLFSTFCTFLNDFERHYTEKERQDPLQLKLGDIPDCFTSYQAKFDYQPALNTLKESWALWLTLHEEHINKHDDFTELESDLIQTLKQTSENLLAGRSNNFYDHTGQAIVRMNLHSQNKCKNDYGAKSCWQNVAKCDPFYKAVALYNQAYITINLAKDDYKAEAKMLLKETKDFIGVYVSEVSNTMVSCNLAVSDNFESHHINNFQCQMEARMNIFKSWMTYVDNALGKLEELEKSNSDAITEECSVYTLSEENNFIITNELMALYEYGLGIVFEVKQKPKFCWDALICFFLGLLQVVAGVLVCALSFGTATQLGLGLISEGVSDMINGIEGMVKGSFDWASWAISKSISIGMSLLSAGFSTIKKAVTSVYNVTKGLLNGTKSFSSVASDVIKSGKHMFTSLKGTIQSGTSFAAKESLGGVVKKMTSSTALKQNFRHGVKFAAQELGKQSVITAMNYGIDEALKKTFEEIFKLAFGDLVCSSVKGNKDLVKSLSDLISSDVPKAALQTSNFKIDQNYEKQVKTSVALLCNDIIPQLIFNGTKVHQVISRLSEVCNAATELLDKVRLSGVAKGVKWCLQGSDYYTYFIELLNNIPTKEIIDSKVIPELLKSINELQGEKYDQDGRHELQDVQRLKTELLHVVAQDVADQFLKVCSEHMTKLMTKTFTRELNKRAGNIVDNILQKHKTQQFFYDQRHKHNMKSASHSTKTILSEDEQKELLQYAEDISKFDHPASAVDIYVLTKSDLINGKGIRLSVVDQHGNQLSEEFYPGTNKSAGDISLRLTKYAKDLHPPEKRGFFTWFKSKIQGEQQLYSGHFEIVQADGKILRVNSENQNCLYHAIAQVTGSNTDDPKKESIILREKVKNEVQKNLELYAPILNLQRGYDYSQKNPGKYAIIGGTKKETDHALQEYSKSIHYHCKSISSSDYKTIKSYRLGFVGKYNRSHFSRQIYLYSAC